MKKASALNILVLTWLGSLAGASASQAAADPALVQKLVAHVQSNQGVKTLNRAILAYHWGTRRSMGLPDSGGIDPRSQSVKGALQFQKNTFFHTGSSFSNVGNGLYLAIDPVATVSFNGGGDDWALAQIFMPPNVRYLNAFDRNVNLLPSALADDLRGKNCPVNSIDGLFQLADAIQACLDLKIALVQVLGVSGVKYAYSASALPNCPTRARVAFMVFDDHAVDWNTMVVFTREAPNDDLVENRILIEQLFAAAPVNPRGSGFPWPQLKGVPPQHTDINRWVADVFMGCSTQHPEENL